MPMFYALTIRSCCILIFWPFSPLKRSALLIKLEPQYVKITITILLSLKEASLVTINVHYNFVSTSWTFSPES